MHTKNGIHLMKMKEELLSPLKCDIVPGTGNTLMNKRAQSLFSGT